MLYNKSELSNFCKTALMAQGVSEKNAQVTTALLIEADEMGIHSHGVKNLHKYIEKIRLGKLNPACQIEVISDMPGCAVLDAHNSIGMVSGYRGMKLAMEKARKTGIGYVCVRNSCHFGAGGVYSNLAAREGMFGIAMSNTDPNMAIPGTIGMTIGNNPFSYAYPKENGQSVFLDIALSATAALKINKAKQAHEQIPNTWLIDDHGNATTDPSWYGNGGALQPIAAYKGYGLSVMVEALTAMMSGGCTCRDVPSWCFNLDSYNHVCHAFLAFDIAAITGEQNFLNAASTYEKYLKSAKTKDERTTVMMPGEIEWNNIQAAEVGIDLPLDVVSELDMLKEMVAEKT